MKKISALLLAVVMAFGMAGCSDSGSSDSDNESSAAAVQTESSAADSSEDATATTTTTTTAPAVTESSQAEVADTSTADENKPARMTGRWRRECPADIPSLSSLRRRTAEIMSCRFSIR